VFADASGHAHGAVAYLLWPTTEGPDVRLISAKARFAQVYGAVYYSTTGANGSAHCFKTCQKNLWRVQDQSFFCDFVVRLKDRSTLVTFRVIDFEGLCCSPCHRNPVHLGTNFLAVCSNGSQPSRWPKSGNCRGRYPWTLGDRTDFLKKSPENWLEPADIESAETYWIKEAQSNMTRWDTDFVDLAPFI